MGFTSIYARIWQSVSFTPDRDVTDSNVYLFVAVLFSVDTNLRDGEPRVWKELNAAWDAKFGLAPGGQPTWADDRYACIEGVLRWWGCPCHGTINGRSYSDRDWSESMHIRPGLSLDLAISGKCDLLGYLEENWLKDCLSRYEAPLDSLEKLHEARAWIKTEGPRWWRS